MRQINRMSKLTSHASVIHDIGTTPKNLASAPCHHSAEFSPHSDHCQRQKRCKRFRNHLRKTSVCQLACSFGSNRAGIRATRQSPPKSFPGKSDSVRCRPVLPSHGPAIPVVFPYFPHPAQRTIRCDELLDWRAGGRLLSVGAAPLRYLLHITALERC